MGSTKDNGKIGAVNYALGPIFLALAAWFIWGPDLLPESSESVEHIDPAMLSTTPRRVVLSHPPTVNIDGFDRTCMDCHKMFPPRSDPPVALAQHTDIHLDHGINNLCRNCHDVEDRNYLIVRGGERITYDQVVDLCAKCHGPTYRDWQSGAHGRTNGYWDTTRGPARRLQCTECHDPHNPRVPAMDPIVPLPGPHSPGAPNIATEHDNDQRHRRDAERDPLRRALREFVARDARRAAAQQATQTDEVEYFEEGNTP